MPRKWAVRRQIDGNHTSSLCSAVARGGEGGRGEGAERGKDEGEVGGRGWKEGGGEGSEAGRQRVGELRLLGLPWEKKAPKFVTEEKIRIQPPTAAPARQKKAHFLFCLSHFISKFVDVM